LKYIELPLASTNIAAKVMDDSDDASLKAELTRTLNQLLHSPTMELREGREIDELKVLEEILLE
jgi:hypothetical protein